jgi:hypothetical protein
MKVPPLAAALLVGVAIASAAQMPRPLPPAQPLSRFLDSLGVAAHVQDTSGPYGDFGGVVLPRLKELGFRHVRTDTMTSAANRPRLIARLKALGVAGITTSLIFDSRLQAGTDSQSPADIVQFLKDAGPEHCIAEGPNEPNPGNPNWVFSYQGVGLNQGLIHYTKDIARAIRADPLTRHVPIYFASFVMPYDLGWNADPHVDFGNIHPYPDGSKPGWSLEGTNVQKCYLPDGRQETPAKPVVATEVGWHTATARTDGFWAKGVPEDVQANYLLRNFFYFFNCGIHRTYIYELCERADPPGKCFAEHHYGILRPDGSPKPAFDALKNLTALLADASGSASGPATLEATLNGDLTDVEATLLQRADGRFVVVLFRNDSAFDIWKHEYKQAPLAGCYVRQPDRALTLETGKPLMSARAATPLTGAQWRDLKPDGRRLTIQVPDHPLIVEFSL